MCISTIMTRGDLFALPCGYKFYVENSDGETLEAIKIAQHEGQNYRLIITDFPELGEDGESLVLSHEYFESDGTMITIPEELKKFGEDLRLCCEGVY